MAVGTERVSPAGVRLPKMGTVALHLRRARVAVGAEGISFCCVAESVPMESPLDPPLVPSDQGAHADGLLACTRRQGPEKLGSVCPPGTQTLTLPDGDGPAASLAHKCIVDSCMHM